MSYWGYRNPTNNASLPYINTPRLAENDGRKSSFDHFKNDPLYSKEALVEQTQKIMILNKFKSFKRFDATATKYSRTDYSISQVRDLQMQLDQKEERIQRLQQTVEAYKESEEQNLLTVQQLKRQLMMLETSTGNALTGSVQAGNNSVVIINNLQREVKEGMQRIMELESRLRTHMEERERAEQERETAEQQLKQLTNSLTNSLLLLDVAGGGALSMTTENIIEKVNETMQENTILKGKLTNMKSLLTGLENEREVDRQTIMRLTNDIERGHHSISKNNLEFENIRVERDTAITKQEELKREVDVLRERLDVNQKSWTQMKRDMEELRERNSLLEADKLRSSVHYNTDGIRFTKFRENLASILTDADINVDPYEESILERIKNIQTILNEKNLRIDMLERKLTTLANELDQQYQQSKLERNKTKHTLCEVEDLQDQLKRIQTKECGSSHRPCTKSDPDMNHIY
ncbi:hypothetical protein HELRODRAFT_179585 [Helobdella robusta]|uniref:Uncharacterized protein n=1 Tax=Helobdella robusta TaxID=6412 RepID=T1FEW7_HELRO|nr:hypothetical protein HELRODRAFT_179585 [Helobdella robusta]ESN95248.1 hypothetical protein HELRODRAFT_179585 [Helobdella robusta]